MAKWNTMTDTPLQMVTAFSKAMGQPLGLDHPGPEDLDHPSNDALWLRWKLIREEYYELSDAIDDEPNQNILKELADLVYVVYGYAATFGWDLDEAVRRVHTSNMSKLGDDGKPILRADGKVLKSDNYQKPSLEDLV